MRDIFTKFKPLFTGLIGIILLYGVYVFGTSMDFSGGSAGQAASIAERTEQIEADLLRQLDRMNKVQLDERLFASESWSALVDYSKPLGEPVMGRPDPFAPLTGR